MKIKVKSLSGLIPAYETSGSAGMDIRAYLDEPIIIAPGKRALIPTGLHFEIPEGFEVQIRARSGLAVKHGIGLTNGIGTIDSDYRGEIKVSLINWGEEPFTVNNGERIAQMVVCRYEKAELIEAEELSETERGSGGFGHTGL
ncbi:MAG: dUTP diphosphatase [Bacillota bacterium]|nr:dUTP diphosphatase [Bacillota bacterium]